MVAYLLDWQLHRIIKQKNESVFIQIFKKELSPAR